MLLQIYPDAMVLQLYQEALSKHVMYVTLLSVWDVENPKLKEKKMFL